MDCHEWHSSQLVRDEQWAPTKLRLLPRGEGLALELLRALVVAAAGHLTGWIVSTWTSSPACPETLKRTEPVGGETIRSHEDQGGQMLMTELRGSACQAQTEVPANKALPFLLVGGRVAFWCSGKDLGTPGWLMMVLEELRGSACQAQKEVPANKALPFLLVGGRCAFWCSGNDLGTSGWTLDAGRLVGDYMDVGPLSLVWVLLPSGAQLEELRGSACQAQTEVPANKALPFLLVGGRSAFWCSGNDLGTSGWTLDAQTEALAMDLGVRRQGLDSAQTEVVITKAVTVGTLSAYGFTVDWAATPWILRHARHPVSELVDDTQSTAGLSLRSTSITVCHVASKSSAWAAISDVVEVQNLNEYTATAVMVEEAQTEVVATKAVAVAMAFCRLGHDSVDTPPCATSLVGAGWQYAVHGRFVPAQHFNHGLPCCFQVICLVQNLNEYTATAVMVEEAQTEVVATEVVAVAMAFCRLGHDSVDTPPCATSLVGAGWQYAVHGRFVPAQHFNHGLPCCFQVICLVQNLNEYTATAVMVEEAQTEVVATEVVAVAMAFCRLGHDSVDTPPCATSLVGAGWQYAVHGRFVPAQHFNHGLPCCFQVICLVQNLNEYTATAVMVEEEFLGCRAAGHRCNWQTSAVEICFGKTQSVPDSAVKVSDLVME
ncbi:hypothetical protein AK812_SmicGene17374 [Symbiodinium microadriaticum]|uniref:Uncharacterized protein n=1 Tax=Symbiodinium microadriaticum TaxID=2951 RepID=A0A1Q9DXW5_SYMMI|nr:hypothetical protein AK812_SmicGene17374 [Symbiodinium microadriaticum]